MVSARGDSKPCTHAGCSGTMQFGREPLRQTAFTMTADGERGWVCSENPGHFQLAAERRQPEAALGSAPHAP
jgi:Rieske Fe-S protein